MNESGNFALKKIGMEKTKENDAVVGTWTSCRYIATYVLLAGSMVLYLLRINFSVAIVCMTFDPEVNQSAPNSTHLMYGSQETQEFEHRFFGFPNLQNAEEGCDDGEDGDQEDETGEFGWDRQLRGTLSSSFFWGYILTQLLGGVIGQRYGFKLTIAAGVFIAALSSFLSPPLARLSPYALLAMRFINGLAQGVFFPAALGFFGNWLPFGERAFLFAFYSSGTSLGSIISFALSGVICADLGWPWVFWIYSIITSIWLVLFMYLVYDTPAQHPRIREAERVYIESSLAIPKRRLQIPWFSVWTSIPIWALIITDFSNGWASNAGLTQLPQYMEDVLEVNIRQNGLYNSLPHLCKFIMSFVFGKIATVIDQRNLLTVNQNRKLMASFGSLVPMGFVIGVGYLDCNTVGLAVLFLTLQEGFTAATRTGHLLAKMDMGPNFAAIIQGITNTAWTASGIVAPIVIASITSEGTRSQWQTCFFMSAGFYLLNFVSFTFFGSAEEQEWAKVQQDDLDLRVEPSKSGSVKGEDYIITHM